MFSATSFFYRRLPSPLHAARASVGATWALALTAATLVLFHPLVLLALALAVLGAGMAAGLRRQLTRTLRTAAIVAVPIVAINVLVSRDGLTVFARLGDLGPFGQGDLTIEAVVYGALIALKVTLLILISTLAGLAIDPEELLRGLRRLSFTSALTASLSTRMIPLLAADSQRVAEAQRTRPGGATTGSRERVRLLGAVIGGSLDRAMDVAATLELRGFAAARPPRRSGVSRPWSRHDIAFACSTVAILALSVWGRLGTEGSLRVYPLIHMPVTAATLVLCGALIAAVLLPFTDRKGIDL